MLLPASFFLICKATPHVLEQDWVHWHLLPFTLRCWLAAHKPRFCVSMSSTISAFQLELCQAPDACNVFTFQVRWVDIEECRRAEAGQDPSQEKVLSDWIRTQWPWWAYVEDRWHRKDRFWIKHPWEQLLISIWCTTKESWSAVHQGLVDIWGAYSKC